ncbi:MAG: hypothetical protein ACRCZF_25925 [Gemmataceae bacterium]
MIRGRFSGFFAFVVVMTWIGPVAGQGFTVGEYDEQTTATNRVDRTATGSFLTADRFTGRVEEAFTRNFGGVMNGEIFSGAFRYGTAQQKTITIPSSLFIGVPGSQASVISGSASFSFEQPGIPAQNSISFNAITNGVAGERVVDVGFTVLSSASWQSTAVQASAVLDNGTVQSIPSISIPQGAGTNDTFFGFSAPAGRSIAQIQVGYTNTGGFTRLWVDDIGFKTAVVGTHLQSGTLLAMGQATESGGSYTIQPGNFNAQELTGFVNRRGIMEIDLPNVGSTPVTVHEALLEFSVNTYTSGSTFPELRVFGYVGDGVVTASDATASNFLIGTRRIDDLGGFAVSLDVAYIQQLLNNGQDLGLLFRSIFDSHQVGMASSNITPTLTIRYSPVPEPTGLLALGLLAGLGWRFRGRVVAG